MTCDEFENLLQEVLDRRETPSQDPFLSAHSKNCSACQRKVKLYESLFDGLELAELPSLSSDFSRQTSRAAKVRRRWSWKKTAGVCVAIAASLLVMVAVANRGGQNGKPDSPNNIVENQPESREPKQDGPQFGPHLAPNNPGKLPPRSQDVAENDKPKVDLMAELQAASEYLSLAKTTEATAHLPGVKPITSSLDAGFDAIRQTLPGGRNDQPEGSKPQASRFTGRILAGIC